MTLGWDPDIIPDPKPIPFTGWIRVVLRGVLLFTVTFGCLIILLLLRIIERPLYGDRRPITPYITQFVCRSAFIIMGIRHRVHGKLMEGQGAVVSNHVSWLDIFALNARKRIYFVSKSEVANWPGIGWLARATGTLFIKRDSREAVSQKALFEARLQAGHKLLFFPEGTSTDGSLVLAFKSTLFAAFYADGLRETLQVQPVTLRYTAPEGVEPWFYGWWGKMDFASHLVQTLASPVQGQVEVIYHDPVSVADFADRKALAKHCELAVRSGMS